MSIASWDLVRVYGTWKNLDGTYKQGSYRVTVPRVTSPTDDVIIPGGEIAWGDLSLSTPSLDVMLPSTDDPDIYESNWKVRIDITFLQGEDETYVIDIPMANRPASDGGNDQGVNLRDFALPTGYTGGLGTLPLGEASGIALLDADGDVVNASGGKVTATAPSGQISHSGLTNLDGDDHLQYLNNTRGDARYAQLSHAHSEYDTWPRTDLSNGSDLDAQVDYGVYRLVGSNTYPNIPPELDGVQGALYVYPAAISDAYVMQRISTGSGYEFVRHMQNDVWQAWSQVSTSRQPDPDLAAADHTHAYETQGAADTAISDHLAQTDPHDTYLHRLGGAYGLWVGTQAEYDLIGSKDSNVVYVIR